MGIVLGSVLLAGGLGALTGAYVARRRHRILADTPTSTIRAMAIGRVEVKGAAQPLQDAWPMVAAHSGEQCLAWRYALEEEHERTVTETHNGQTRTRTEHYWVTLEQAHHQAPFAMVDWTGRCTLDPTGGTVPLPAGFVAYNAAQCPTPAAVAKLGSRGWFGRRRRLSESWLPLGTSLFVQADAMRRDGAKGNGNEALTLQDPRQGPFIISTKSEESLTRAALAWFWVALSFGLLFIGFASFSFAVGGP